MNNPSSLVHNNSRNFFGGFYLSVLTGFSWFKWVIILQYIFNSEGLGRLRILLASVCGPGLVSFFFRYVFVLICFVFFWIFFLLLLFLLCLNQPKAWKKLIRNDCPIRDTYRFRQEATVKMPSWTLVILKVVLQFVAFARCVVIMSIKSLFSLSNWKK